ncbi:MAG: response regulator transcription factor [Sulfuricurvum sp.]|uniref:response regulator transcription factor n=1 Tax=Sulfuricurvum sp. TaxID=2025608 RepID=UPI0025FA2BE7|nr:response regulator transcription factor [Sulfuricurvum sp.]MBV5321977.1 response regulator transcription factor [Sulfuricurvum sp.]
MKLLLLENTHSFALSIINFLTTLGHDVNHFDGKADFLEMIRSGPYDVFLLDLNASNEISADCIKGIVKIFPQTPIILLSSTHDLYVIEKALDLGCSDYIKKPFEFKELELKIRQFNKNIFPIKSSLISLSQNYAYDTDTSSLYYKGLIQAFTKKEKTLLALFMLNRNKFITEEQISLALWNNRFAESTTIRSNIYRLRKKLKEDFIQTYRQEGYIWEDNIYS